MALALYSLPVGSKDDKGRIICGGFKRLDADGNPTYCQDWRSILPNGRCKMHGGRKKNVMDNLTAGRPNQRLAKYSKYMSPEMAKQYEASVQSENLLRMHDEIALVDVRLAELLGRAKIGESAELWKRFEGLMAEAAERCKRKEWDKVTATIQNTQAILDSARSDYVVWKHIGNEVDRRARLVKTEHEHKIAENQMMSVAQVMLLMAAISEIIMRNVRDEVAANIIKKDIGRLISLPPPKPDTLMPPEPNATPEDSNIAGNLVRQNRVIRYSPPNERNGSSSEVTNGSNGNRAGGDEQDEIGDERDAFMPVEFEDNSGPN